MHNLAIAYQTEKKEVVRNAFASVVIEALHNLHNLHNAHNINSEECCFTVKIKEIVQKVLSFSEPSEGETEDDESKEKNTRSLSTRVGMALRQLRFRRDGQVKRGEPVQWLISCDVLQKCVISHGLLHLFPEGGYEGYAAPETSSSHEDFSANAASPQNIDAQPSDPQNIGYEGYAGYEVMRDNKNSDLQKNSPPICVCGEPLPENRKVCFVCGSPRGTMADAS